MIKFSVVTVAKGRYKTFRDACDSIWTMASEPYEVEHIVMYDDGDEEMINFLGEYTHSYPQLQIKCVPVKLDDYENRNMHRDYWNPGAKLAEGQIVFGLCNDTIITTKNYDKIMLDALADFKLKYKHSIVQFLVDDDSGKIEEYPKNWFCSWIILSAGAVIAMNGLAPRELPFQGADRAVYQIFANTIKPAIIDLRDKVHTIHMSHYTGRCEVDAITKHRPKNFNNPCVLSTWQLVDYVGRVNNEIFREGMI